MEFSIRDDTGKYGAAGSYITIKSPDSYKPIIATTSTEDSDRTQDLVMHNTPMGSIVGYDLTWGEMKTDEVRKILDLMINKPFFSMHHYDIFLGWTNSDFYASNFQVEAVRLRKYVLHDVLHDEELWKGLTLNIRPINPLIGVRA